MKRSITIVCRLMLIAAAGASLATGAPTTRPLDHSPGELAWDAWLQQGSRQAAPPRRITTKSLFVFPHLGPESLPACAEGYRPDSMGRCVKVVKVDENAHLDFLLQKLNSQFATETSEGQDVSYDYDIDPQSDTSGPFQFNIPLALQSPGSKQESSDETQEVLVIKKQPASSKNPAPETKPTSSPEVVPEYNDRKQFFLEGSPAANGDILPQSSSVPAGPLSILIRNSTNTGLTLLAPANGNFQKKSPESSVDKTVTGEVNKELENVKIFTVGEENVLIPSTTINSVSGLPLPETIILQTSYSNIHEKIKDAPEIGETKHETDLLNKESAKGETSPTTDNGPYKKINPIATTNIQPNASLVNQIEALKVGHNTEKPTNAAANVPSSINHRLKPESSSQGINAHFSGIVPSVIESTSHEITAANDRETADMEEKIKIISQFADVSRNTEGSFPIGSNFQKKTSDYVRFPSSHGIHTNSESDLSKAASSSTFVQFPPDYVSVPSSQNSVNIPPGLQNHGIGQQPFYYNKDRNIQESSERNQPYWLPYGWNVQNPSGEYNLMDLWSRMSSMQRYPYNVRFEQDRRSSRVPTLYPGPREAGGRLNVRHTPLNYRQGRDEALRGRQGYQDESMNYKRSRHPHFRESEELSRIIEAFNGR